MQEDISRNSEGYTSYEYNTGQQFLASLAEACVRNYKDRE
jgi:hypothetical protein